MWPPCCLWRRMEGAGSIRTRLGGHLRTWRLQRSRLLPAFRPYIGQSRIGRDGQSRSARGQGTGNSRCRRCHPDSIGSTAPTRQAMRRNLSISASFRRIGAGIQTRTLPPMPPYPDVRGVAATNARGRTATAPAGLRNCSASAALSMLSNALSGGHSSNRRRASATFRAICIRRNG